MCSDLQFSRADGGKQLVADENEGVSRLPPIAKRVAVSLAIALGLVLVGVGLSKAITGRDAQKLPPEIQSINPVRSATQVQSQESVKVDLIDGYTGVLTINNVVLQTFSLGDLPDPQPGQQVSLPLATIFEPGNYTLSYTPVKGAPIEKFATGVNIVQVSYWKLTDGPSFTKSFTWQFDVV